MIAIIDGDVLLYISIWGAETKEEASNNFKELFTAINEDLFAEDYVMALGGPDNFRVDLYDEYKANRSKSKSTRPEWFLDLKSDIANEYENCILTDYCEADDMVRTWAEDCRKGGKDFVVVSVDKDLDCIEGKHYNPRKSELYEVNNFDADRHYWKQILMGDSTDNIPGLPGIGPKKAEKLLDETPKEFKQTVCAAYADYYGKDKGYEYLIANGRLIHIWRHIGDYFKIDRDVYNELCTWYE
jgi:5'-3' exonuclease